MSEPTFTETTESLYERIPKVHRDEDKRLDYPLKTWISGTGDVAGQIGALYDRFDYSAPDGTSDLVDPATANPEWLEYVGQMLGVVGINDLTPERKREVLADPSVGYRAGTPEAIATAARTILDGTKFVRIYHHTTAESALYAASEWDVLVVTRQGEAQGDVVKRVTDLGAKPAGVILHHREWEVTWEDLHTNYPTWADINAAPNWDAIEQTGI